MLPGWRGRAKRASHCVVGRAPLQGRWLAFGAVLAIMLLWVAAAAFGPFESDVHLLALTDHIGVLCLLAISALLSPLHHVYEFAAFAGLAFAAFDRIRAWREARTLLHAVTVSPIARDSELAGAAAAAGLKAEQLVRIAESPLPAFTLGAFRPRVFVSDRLETILSRDELVAVLAHEGEHLRRRDPLRLSSMRFVSRALFWLPALRALESQLAEETELRADGAAARKSGIATASALLALVKHFGRVQMPAMSTGFSPHEFLALRVKLLTGDDSRSHARVSRSALVTTLGVLALLWTAALAELHQSTHPQHVVTGTHECREDRSHPLRQFLCLVENHSSDDIASGAGTSR